MRKKIKPDMYVFFFYSVEFLLQGLKSHFVMEASLCTYMKHGKSTSTVNYKQPTYKVAVVFPQLSSKCKTIICKWCLRPKR